MKRYFTMLAAYNHWANIRLYDMAAALPDELYRKPVGVYFKSRTDLTVEVRALRQ